MAEVITCSDFGAPQNKVFQPLSEATDSTKPYIHYIVSMYIYIYTYDKVSYPFGRLCSS